MLIRYSEDKNIKETVEFFAKSFKHTFSDLNGLVRITAQRYSYTGVTRKQVEEEYRLLGYRPSEVYSE